MIGTEIKLQGKSDYIKDQCCNIPLFDLDGVDFDTDNYWYLIQCLSGDKTTARQKTEATVKTTKDLIVISDMHIISESELEAKHYNIYYLLVSTQ